MRHLLLRTLLILHWGTIWALSFSLEPELRKDPFSQNVSNETDSESIEIKALLDYESGLVFYKDSSISACLVEKIPDSILEASGTPSSPTFKLPILSEEVCIGRENELLPTEPLLISEPGLLFCSGLPILDIKKLVQVESAEKIPVNAKFQNRLVRKRRQSNGYYRRSDPVADARARSNWNPAAANQASQAQVQGQVFGSGVFSGQAQSQNGGMSQSQVQLSGVGIRGQIASSSGNAQAQLSLGQGQGSGQAAGLGEGPSNSQVQVSLAQREGDESMASASATSGGARAEVSGIPTTGSFGGIPSGHFGGLGQNGHFRSGGSPQGFIPGTRLYDETGALGTLRGYDGSGQAYGDRRVGGQTAGQIPSSSSVHGLGQGNQGLLGTGGISGVGDSRFPSGTPQVRNGHSGGTFGIGHDQSPAGGPIVGTGPVYRQGLGTGDIDMGLGTQAGRGLGGPFDQSTLQNGHRAGHYPSTAGDGQRTVSPDTTGIYGQDRGAQLPIQNGAGSTPGHGNSQLGISQGRPGQIGSGLHIGGDGTPGGNNGLYRTPNGNIPLQGGVGGLAGGNGRYGGSPTFESNGVRGGSVGGRPHAQSSTPGAYASTYGLGQAQAQTVYFGNAGNGQYIPVRYDQSSQPGGPPGIHRFQDQQVGLGSAGQHQRLSQNGGGTGISSAHGSGVANGHSHTSLRNGQTSYTTYGHGGGGSMPAVAGQQPVGSGVGISPTTTGDFQQLHSGSGTQANGAGGSAVGQDTISHGGGGGAVYRPDQTSSSVLPGSQPSTGFTNGLSGGHGQPGTYALPGYPSGPVAGYQNGHRQTSTSTSGRNGQTYTTNGYSNGGYGQQQIPTRNGNAFHGNGLPSLQPSQATIYPNGQATQLTGQHPGQTYSIPAGQIAHIPGQLPGGQISGVPATGHAATEIGQDGFSPSYGISRPSQDDPDGRKCTIITFSCTIVVESNGRAKICRPNAVKMNGNGNGNAGGGNGAAGSKICCC